VADFDRGRRGRGSDPNARDRSNPQPGTADGAPDKGARLLVLRFVVGAGLVPCVSGR
jgi:hypothetical protein